MVSQRICMDYIIYMLLYSMMISTIQIIPHRIIIWLVNNEMVEGYNPSTALKNWGKSGLLVSELRFQARTSQIWCRSANNLTTMFRNTSGKIWSWSTIYTTLLCNQSDCSLYWISFWTIILPQIWVQINDVSAWQFQINSLSRYQLPCNYLLVAWSMELS